MQPRWPQNQTKNRCRLRKAGFVQMLYRHNSCCSFPIGFQGSKLGANMDKSQSKNKVRDGMHLSVTLGLFWMSLCIQLERKIALWWLSQATEICQDRSAKSVRPSQSGQVRSGQVRSGQVRSGQATTAGHHFPHISPEKGKFKPN